MKKLCVIMLFALQGMVGMEPSVVQPVIVLDVELITDETPRSSNLSNALTSATTLFRNFSIREIYKLNSSKNSIIADSEILRKTMYGATNIIKKATENAGLSFSEKQVKILVDIGLAPEIKPDGVELLRKLAEKNISLILATHHDAYHFQGYSKYLKQKHAIELKDLSHSAIVIADPYNSAHEEVIAPTHTVAPHPRPSESYASAIKSLASDRPVMLFDTNENVVMEYAKGNMFPAYHAITAADVEKVLEELGI